MKRKCLVFLVAFVFASVAWGFSFAVTDSGSLSVTAVKASRATLTLDYSTLTFPDSDPDTTPSIPAVENFISVTSKAVTAQGNNVPLTVLATGDLVSGTDVIPVSNITWTATGSGYIGGTVSKVAAQTVGSWTGPGARGGTLSFFLANDWIYAVGTYTTTLDFTLTAP